MKKTVLTFGLISGALMAGMMFATLPFADRIGFDKGEIIGYTTIIVAFMFVFVGVRTYRENVGNGQITFSRAFAVGILITLIACVCYVAAWEILYFKFMPDFADKFASYKLEKMKAAGASPIKIAEQMQEVKRFKTMLDNPFISAAIGFVETFPIGFIMTLISAAILRRKAARVAGAPQTAQLQTE